MSEQPEEHILDGRLDPLFKHHCRRCHHNWWPRSPIPPQQCPRPGGCGSFDWHKPYVRPLSALRDSTQISLLNCAECMSLYDIKELSPHISGLPQPPEAKE